MLERLWSKENTPPLVVGVEICRTTLQINLAVSQKIGNSSTSRPSYTTSGQIPKGCSTILQGHLLNYVHSSFISNSQKLETTQISLNQRMDNENVGHLHNTTQLLKTITS